MSGTWRNWPRNGKIRLTDCRRRGLRPAGLSLRRGVVAASDAERNEWTIRQVVEFLLESGFKRYGENCIAEDIRPGRAGEGGVRSAEVAVKQKGPSDET